MTWRSGGKRRLRSHWARLGVAMCVGDAQDAQDDAVRASASGRNFFFRDGRRWGKRLSSIVVYLDRPVVVHGNSVWFGGALHPVERYVFAQ